VPTIFLVDDDEAVLKALTFAFGVEGLDVRAYLSAEALLAERWVPEQGCLVLDHYMPNLTGLDLLARLRARGCRLPTILITTQADAKMRQRAQDLEVAAILEKPLSDGALIELARDALNIVPP
jgi:two-component system, LuxR family, response regulator FixJ